MTSIVIPDLSRLEEGARKFVTLLRPGAIYAFYGKMGAGKTTFISEICRQMGVTDDISSPTFSIVNEYDTSSGEVLYHFDCYRLDSEEEALDIGSEDYFNSGNTCFIEWPENLGSLLPEEAISVKIEVKDDDSRIITVED